MLLDEETVPVTRRWPVRTRLLVGVAAAWAGFLLLHVLLVGRWWPWLILEATPPLVVLAVPVLLAALVPLARPVRRGLAVTVALLLLAGLHLTGYGPPGGGGTPAGTSVKVFAWSTDYWQMSDDEDDFYGFLRRQDADVYLLQEYLYWAGTDQPIRIDDSARLRAELPGYQLSVDGELLTLTRLPVVATHHPPAPGGGTDWYWKGAKSQRTDVRVDGRTVSFYNVHLPVPFRLGDSPLSGAFYRSLEEQGRWRIGELDRLRTDLAGNPNPAVVAGDFNSPWTELSSPGGEAHDPTGSLLPASSWPVSDYPVPRLWRLDWLWTTGDLAVPDYRFGGGSEFSDHAAQEIRVVVPEG